MSLLSKLNLKISERLKDRTFRAEFFRETAQDSLASQLRYLREFRGMRQSDLADATGTKQSAISRLERGADSGWSFSTMLKLAEALDARVKVTFEPAEDAIREIAHAEWDGRAAPADTGTISSTFHIYTSINYNAPSKASRSKSTIYLKEPA